MSVPKTITDAEKFVAKRHLALVENRVAIKALTDLEVNTSVFANQKSELVQKIKSSNQSALETLSQDYKGRNINLEADKELINFFNTELPKKLEQLSTGGTAVLQEQQSTIEKLTAIDSVIANIYNYNPQTDLGGLDPASNQDELLQKSYNAKVGLENIDQALVNLTNEPAVLILTQLRPSLAILEELINETENDNFSQARTVKRGFIDGFEELQEFSFNQELSLIKSIETIKLITKQTNIILEYEFILQKINKLQQIIKEN